MLSDVFYCPTVLPYTKNGRRKDKFMKKYFTIMLVFLMILGLCACSPQESVTPTLSPEKTNTSQPTPEPTPDKDVTLSDFVIIYPQGDDLTVPFKDTAMQLRISVLSSLAINIGTYSDIIDEDSGMTEHTYEILIGNTNREESAKAMDGLNLRYYDYVIKYEGTKLVINGGSESAIKSAVDYFAENMLDEDLKTVEGCKKLTETNVKYSYASYANRLYIADEYITSFKLVSNKDDAMLNSIIEDITLMSGELISVGSVDTPTEFEIIIGECGRDEYRQVYDKLKDFEYAVEIVNGKLVVAGKTEIELLSAIEKFREEYLTMSGEKVNITTENNYICKHNFPVESITIGGYDISEYVIVTSPNNMGVAKKLSKLINQMSGITLKTVTDGAGVYDKAIVLSKSGDARAKELLKNAGDDKVMVVGEGTKIYLGTNSVSYGDLPAVNAFVNDVLGYDIILGKANSGVIKLDNINYTVNLLDNVEEFIITQYFGLRKSAVLNSDGSIKTDKIDENAQAGMNVIDIDFGTEINKKVLEYCSQIGLRCTVYDGRLTNLVNVEELPENWQETIKSVVEDYKDYTAMYYYGLRDEPSEALFERLGLISNLLKKLDPARSSYINLFPNYASNEQLQSDSYEDHVKNFIKVVNPDLVSYDNYSLINGEDILSNRNKMFFENLEIIRKYGLETDTDYMIIVLLVEHYNYRDLNRAEIKWEVYQSLAYGVSQMSYFTYAAPGDPFVNDSSMLDLDGNKTQHYYDVQAINKELRIIGNALVGKLSLDVLECRNGNSFGYGAINTIGVNNEVRDVGVTVGCFEDDMMLIANRDYDNAVEVSLTSDDSIIVLNSQTGEWSQMTSNTLLIEAGDAVLVKTVK